MDRKQLEEYILKLSMIEKELTDDSTEELVYIKELDKVLSSLRDDINSSQSKTSYGEDYSIKIKVKKLHENTVLPKYSKVGDAGSDLVATTVISEDDDQITYGTGVSMEIPQGFVGLVFPRSSIRKYGLVLSNSVGVIDSGYRGEIQATFYKPKNVSFKKYEIGDRIAQIIILPYPQITYVESDVLSDSDRGDGGFGSTGK